MALPVTISGTNFPNQAYYLGPFMSSGGNVYIFLLDSTDISLIEAWKATDPTSSFTEQNSGSKPNLTNNIESLWAFAVGDVIHMATQEVTTARVGYHTFSMATDTWGTVNEAVVTPANAPVQAYLSASIAVRSDGDVIILYQGSKNASGYDTVQYARKESGSWTTGVDVANSVPDRWLAGPIVSGSNDRMHFFFEKNSVPSAHQRCLRSDNTMETLPATFDSTLASTNHLFMPGTSYESGGAQKIRIPYLDSGVKVGIAKLDSADSPTVTVDGAVSDQQCHAANFCGVGCLAVLGKVLHLHYSEGASTFDLFRDTNNDGGGWGTDVEDWDAVTINRISNNIYIRGSNYKLGFVVLDSTTVKYNEIDLGVAAVGHPAMRRMGRAPVGIRGVRIY